MPRPKRKLTTPSSELRRKLEEVQRTRADAENDCAYPAAASLHRLEVDILEQLWEREAIEAREAEERAEAEAAQRDGAAVFAAVLDVARSLPPELRDQLVAALSHQPVLRVVGE